MERRTGLSTEVHDAVCPAIAPLYATGFVETTHKAPPVDARTAISIMTTPRPLGQDSNRRRLVPTLRWHDARRTKVWPKK